MPDDEGYVTLKRAARPRLRLICFPFAGGGPYAFLPWAKRLPDDVEVAAVRLPGRETRMREAPFSSMAQVTSALERALASRLHVPYAFAGHSMGALVAFELTRALRRSQRPLPRHLIVTGRRAPQCPPPSRMRHLLDDAAFAAELRRLGGTPPEMLADPELRAMLFPLLRADFGVCDTYRYTSEPPLDLPITALAGTHDPEAPPAEVAPWEAATCSGFTYRAFAGAHFFIQTEVDSVLATVRATLDATS